MRFKLGLLLAALVWCVAQAPAGAHSTSTSAQAMPTGKVSRAERRLRAFEAATIGPSHAADHARLRTLIRSGRDARLPRRSVRALARASVNGPADQVGRWGAQFDIPVFAINAVMLPTGKVLFFAYPNPPGAAAGPSHVAHAYLWDPSQGTGSGAFEQVDPPIDPRTGEPANIWCGGASLLADGRVLVTGGNLSYPQETGGRPFTGLKQVYTFNPYNETWTRQPDMRLGRWYPSQLLMADGRTLIMGGQDDDPNDNGDGKKNDDLEIFTPSPDLDGVGTIELLGPAGVLGNAGMPPVGDLYPHMFWMPNGRGLVAGPWTVDSWSFAAPGNPPAALLDRPFERLARSRLGHRGARARRSAGLEPRAPDRRLGQAGRRR